MTDVALRPSGGSRRFRSAASFAVQSGVLVVTGGSGSSRRFPLTGGPQAPAAFVESVGEGRSSVLVLVDGTGSALSSGLGVEWDRGDVIRFARNAGLRFDVVEGRASAALLRRRNRRSDHLALGTWHDLTTTLVLLVAVLLSPLLVAVGLISWWVLLAIAVVAGVVVVGSGRRSRRRREP